MSSRQKRTYHKGNVREDLLSMAEKILKEETVQKITVRSLTSRVGVTPGNFYNHFENLNELLANVAAKKMRERIKRVKDARNKHRKPLLRLKAGARETVHMAFENPESYRLMMGNLVPSLTDYPVFYDAAEDSFEALNKELYGEGVYDRHDLKASHKRCPHSYALMSLLNGVTRDVIDGLVNLDSLEEIDEFTDTMMDSLLCGRAFFDLEDRLT